MIKIKLNESRTPAMLNEALEGLSLPAILNTKVMESVSINPKAQEVYGRFIRDWLMNWGWNNMTEVSKYIGFGIYDTKKYFRHIFVRFYKNNGGNPKELFAKKDYYAFTPKAWDDRLADINMTGLIPKKLDQWRADFTKALEPGQGNTIDREIFDKTMDQFIDLRLYMQDQLRLWYGIVSNREPTPSIDSKGNNFSDRWSKMRKVLKSVRKYLVKRDVPEQVYEEINRIYNEMLLRSFNIMYRSRTVGKLRKFMNADGKNWVDIEKLLKDPGGFRDSIDAIGDFLKRAKYRDAYNTMCADVADSDEIAPKGKPCIIKNYDDGYFWFSRGGASCEIFGEEGRNCGGGNYTLIDLQRKIKRGDQTKRSWFIGLDYDVERGILYQILGFGNSFPMEKYWSYIRDFIATFDVKDIDAEVFNYLAQNSKVSQKEIVEFIMAVGNDSVKENWNKRIEFDKDKDDPTFDAEGNLVDDIMAHAMQEVRKKLQKNLALKFPMEIDENKAHAVRQWYKNKRSKIK
tara:strand:+ start:1918 stop:3462 length:1545 start_codon:yes stop_codon:yes gene_type:complete